MPGTDKGFRNLELVHDFVEGFDLPFHGQTVSQNSDYWKVTKWEDLAASKRRALDRGTVRRPDKKAGGIHIGGGCSSWEEATRGLNHDDRDPSIRK
ncbi:hypothetical protein MTBSS4_670004 [Magnetospirillum sp. SS-4]|nr:hypothetical protein MTBSS4_670004 [Magnetospirillum sp. SS-4]